MIIKPQEEYQEFLLKEAKKEAQDKMTWKRDKFCFAIAGCLALAMTIYLNFNLEVLERLEKLNGGYLFSIMLFLITTLVVGMTLSTLARILWHNKISREKINQELKKIVNEKLKSHPKKIKELKENLENYEQELLFLEKLNQEIT